MPKLSAQEVNLIAPAKINLSLYVGPKRESDGYHPLSSFMVPLDLHDNIHIIYEPSDCQLSCECQVEGNPELTGQTNLVTKMVLSFGQKMEIKGRMYITLQKNIPLKAGLGGGSSDGATVIKWLNNQLDNPLTVNELALWAAKYSADSPFFLYDSAAMVSGIGENVQPIENFPKTQILLVKPPAEYSTQQIYQRYDRLKGATKELPPDKNSHQLGHNDLLNAAIKFCPAIQTALDDINLAIAKSYVTFQTISLSGSGSTCYALLGDDPKSAKQLIGALNRHPGWFYCLTTTI